MSDLLRNLAVRTLTPEVGPQPRLRSRFEPLSAIFSPVTTETRTSPIAAASSTHQRVSETRQPKSPRQREEAKATTPHPTIREIEQLEQPQREETERVSTQATREVIRRVTLPQVKVLSQPATDVRALPAPRNSLQPRKQVESTQKPSIRAEAAVHDRPSSVQVTIGRVEVRAMIQTPERRSRVATKPGLMSLDEYLSRRAKGGVS